MANYYTDHPEYDFYLNHPEMQRVVELKERNFADKDKFEDAPVDFEDAIENYKRVLEITGDIAANIIEPNSEDVDLEGPHLVDGRMHYASKTYENIEATRKAGLWHHHLCEQRPRRSHQQDCRLCDYRHCRGSVAETHQVL